MKVPSLKKNIILFTLFQILNLVTPLITAPYTARVLGAEGIGINSFTDSVQTYFLLLATLGTYTYGTREIACNRNDPKKRSQIFWEIELLTLITTAICLLAWGVLILQSEENRLYYMIKTISLFAAIFEISWFYGGMERFDYPVLVSSAIKFLFIGSIFVFVKSSEDLPIFIGLLAVSSLLSNVSLWIFLPQYICKPDFRNIHIWRHFKNTLIYFVPTIATSIYTVLDKTLIGLITQENTQNGYYEQATKIINMAKAVAFNALNNVLVSRMSFLYMEKKDDEIRERTTWSMEYITFMCVGLSFGIWAVAPRFVPSFFGPDYANVVPLLRIFSPIILIVGISNCIASHYFTPMGLQKQNATFLIAGAIVNLILNCILIPSLGSQGAAIASVIAELVITILYVACCKGFITAGQLLGHLWKKLVAAGAMVAVIFLIDGWFTRPLFAVAVQILLGFATYCLVLIVLRDRSVTIVAETIMRKIRKNKA